MQVVRASGLSDLLDCPARWESKFVKGMRLPSSAASQLGTAVHAGTAIWDNAVINHKEPSLEECETAVSETIFHPQNEVDWGEENQSQIEKQAHALLKLYCEQIAPNQNYVADEVTCEPIDLDELGISLTGTTDRIYRDPLTGKYGIADLKTGKSAVSADGTVKTTGHVIQLGVYEVLSSVALGVKMEAPALIVGLQNAKTPAGRRVGIGTVENASNVLLGNPDAGTKGVLEVAAQFLKTGLFFGNPRSSLCNVRYCPNYHICSWK